MGIKTKLIQVLLDGIKEYRSERGLGIDADPDDSDDDGEVRLLNDNDNDAVLVGGDGEGGGDEILDNLVKSVSVMEYGGGDLSDDDGRGGDGDGFDHGEDDGSVYDDDEDDEGDEYGYNDDDDDNSVDLTRDIPGVKFEELFPGDNENFPVKGEFARVHYTAR
jgi:hypothetical protein